MRDITAIDLTCFCRLALQLAFGQSPRNLRPDLRTDVPNAASLILDTGQPLPLPDGKTVDTSGVTVRAAGATLGFKLKGDKTVLRNANPAMAYKGS